jgi:hypothetical protein
LRIVDLSATNIGGLIPLPIIEAHTQVCRYGIEKGIRDCHPFLSFKIGGCTKSINSGTAIKDVGSPEFKNKIGSANGGLTILRPRALQPMRTELSKIMDINPGVPVEVDSIAPIIAGIAVFSLPI